MLQNRRLLIIKSTARKPIPSASLTLLGAHSVTNKYENSLQYPTQFLNSTSSGSVPDHITLKTGLISMPLRNINTPERYCIRIRDIVQHMTPRLLSLIVAAGMDNRNKLLFRRISCQPGSDEFPALGFYRLWFPIFICFKVTTN